MAFFVFTTHGIFRIMAALHLGINIHIWQAYNVIAVYEALGVQGIPVVNDLEGLDVKYFSLDEPIPDLNPF
ncbi:hypothetical protein M5X06_23015 [Paenibacillus alvei]|uniref:Uncharacterized protein n=1 Tax=Paenibacillus alvei TaxID=44250 RepID=A0ABT4GY35_PAEAL|nr:hypothetical protein [Paenibacillus alvei]MCY9761618.1 hypothetical protein [Paenibacillus alvei]MCY9769659.1 hypothetical protein [Paenibacillus alvei]